MQDKHNNTTANSSGSREKHVDPIRQEISWHDLDKRKFFLSSTGVFFATRLLVYPSILVKTRLQIQEDNAYRNTRDAFRKIWAKDGIRGFYRGFVSFSLGVIPSQFVYITMLEKTKSIVKQSLATSSLFKEEQLSFGNLKLGHEQVASFVGGWMASLSATTVSTPVDVISQRLMVQKDTSSTKYSGAIDGFKKIVKYDGVTGLWRGLGASVITYAPSSSLFWFYYSLFKHFVMNQNFVAQRSDNAGFQLFMSALCGSSASATTAFCTNILDTSKTYLQTQDLSHLNRSQRNLFSIMVYLAKRDGILRTWKRGLIPRIMSHAPVSAISIALYESVKKWSLKDGASPVAMEHV